MLYYILDTKKGDMSHLQKAEIINLDKFLLFDSHTKRNLELTETLRTKRKNLFIIMVNGQNKNCYGK